MTSSRARTSRTRGTGVRYGSERRESHGGASEHRAGTAGHRAVPQGDLDGIKEVFADDVLWHVGGNHPLSGDYRGRDDLISYFRRVQELSGGSLELEASTRRVRMRCSSCARGPEPRPDDGECMTYDSEGRVDSAWFLPDDQAQMNGFK
ncbi:MAG: nuclear transport factor 2 family protein [Actinomycetota bacterium]